MKPAHPLAQHYLQSGLFDRVGSFAEIEVRIMRLPTAQERGDAFEVFAEAYLATQPEVQARAVWTFNAIPRSVQEQLSLGTLRDMGVDGVLETSLGDYRAYQAKFRSQRAGLSWRELSTFMGLTDQVARVLVTNSNDLPELMNDRSGFFCIRGNDLDRLEARDFETLRSWLASGEIEKQRKSPRPHQRQALHAIVLALQHMDRATAVMACGTGKTLLSLWVAEATGSKNVLVLVPSLALIRQTLHEWLHETSWGSFAYVCVCSDPSVVSGTDNLAVRQSDLDFPVTTDPEGVRRFFSTTGSAVRVVFSTYQSAKVVAEGLMGWPAFDLGVFDEAHKTAGREGTRFSFALSDDNLPITKRLFITATPRHYDIRSRDKEGDSKLVFSMDVSEVYGPVVHTLSFAEAARQGIICDYKVVISVVTSDMVTQDLLSRGEVLVEGDAVAARQVANQIALQKAVEKYRVSRIFTFHSSVKSARSFTAPGGEGVGNHLPGFEVFHVNGEMRTTDRDRLLTAFGAAAHGLMSNARCLTEGVDVPAVDMVAFMSPRKSKVDIVQATGRAMRKARDKLTGYVMLPVYLEQHEGESLEEALARADFQDAWDVLQAMKEQDAALADIIRELREERGRRKGYDDSRLREHIEVLGPSASLDALRQAITAQCVDRLGVNWDESFGKVVAFKESTGHCNVPVHWPEDPALGVWVSTQRTTKKRGALSPERVRRLEALAFVWDSQEASWEESFAKLQAYRERTGDCNVPHRAPEDPELGLWVGVQRRGKNRGTLSAERIRRLEEVGFLWNPFEVSWEESFAKLKSYRDRFGHCNVPAAWPEDPDLGSWVGTQRWRKTQGKLSPERVRRLEALGVVWESRDASWEESFAKLKSYRDRFGHCNVPATWPEDPDLGSWVGTQRRTRKQDRLSPKRVRQLEAFGFVWDQLDASWEEYFAKLKSYRERIGNSNVPGRWPGDASLGKWVSNQRTRKAKGVLGPERVRRLEALGFVWDQLDGSWEESFASLNSYRERFGNCNVPHGWPEDPALARWVKTQRKVKRRRKLSTERVHRLEEIGFEWERR